eukprot:sb/3467485/
MRARGSMCNEKVWKAGTLLLLLSLRVTTAADDFTILIRARTIEECIERAQRVADIISEWENVSNVSMNPLKTKWVLFSKKHYRNTATPPGMNITAKGTTIERVPTIRYLGVYLNERMKWGPHISHLRSTSQVLSHNLNVIGRDRGGLSAKMIDTFHKTVIEGKTLYAASAWADQALSCNANKRKLDTISSSTAKLILGAGRKAPNHLAHSLAAITPLSIAATTSSTLGKMRLTQLQATENHKMWSPNFKKKFTVLPFEENLRVPEEGLIVYTDGSRIKRCWRDHRSRVSICYYKP